MTGDEIPQKSEKITIKMFDNRFLGQYQIVEKKLQEFKVNDENYAP